MDMFCPGAEAIPFVVGLFVTVVLVAVPWIAVGLRAQALDDDESRAFRSRCRGAGCLGSLGIVTVFVISTVPMVVALRAGVGLELAHLFLSACLYIAGSAMVLWYSVKRIREHASAASRGHTGCGGSRE